MIVVGGVYHELCRDPFHDELFGSGVRAAYALSNAQTPGQLHSVATAAEAELVKAMGIALSHVERLAPVRFMYDTPVSRPIHDYRGTATSTVNLHAEGDSVLVFGMVDANPSVKARRLVVDPQSPGLTNLKDHIDFSAEELVIVANRREILGLAGGTPGSIEEATKEVRRKYSAEAVVAKCGPRGAVLVDDTGISLVDPYPTQDVWPIGSGDVFSAVFAWYWGEQGESPFEAARRASMATATWCSKGALQVVRRDGAVIPPRSDGFKATLRDARIYLAGPFFNYGQRWLVDLVRDSLIDLGIGVFSPIHDVGIGPPDSVAPADIQGLEKCDAVLALLDGLDSGTLFEVGFAQAKGIPVVGFAERTASSDLTMLIGTGIPVYSKLAQAAYHAAWSSLR